MGQCSLTDMQNGCGDMFGSKQTDDTSLFSKENFTEQDRMLWQHQLNLSSHHKLPDPKFWAEPITTPHPCFIQISKDVTRTFPQSSYFGSKYNIQRFQKVLNKVALYFPHIGYTQGLNFAVGFLMISGCENEQAFRLLVKIVLHQKILAIGLYEDGFPLVNFYCEVFWNLLEKKMPLVYALLRKSHITDDLWLFQWFISLFLYNFPLEYAKKMWDFILCKKEMAVVLVALGIIKSIRNQMLQIDCFDDFQFLELMKQFKNIEFCKKFLNLNKLFQYANLISKMQIDKAISQTKCLKNFYRIYFSSSVTEQKQQWMALIKKFELNRANLLNNKPTLKYQKEHVFEKIEKLILSKYKLYQSELKKQNSNHRKSNISQAFSLKTYKSKLVEFPDFNKHKK